jgi:hypothetical protein
MTKKQKQIKMKRTIIKLHDKKYADLIDHNVRECIRKNENYEIEYRGKSMTLTPEDLKTKCVGRQYIAEPKYGDKPYHLLSYLWEPTKTVEK